MKDIIDIGWQGAEKLHAVVAGEPLAASSQLDVMLQIVKRFPRTMIEADTADGVKRSVGVHALRLQNQQVFALAHQLAPYEPMVYARQGDRSVLGMLSPNYDSEGRDRLDSLKVIPLAQAYPLTSDLRPDARMATMLTGAVNAEGRGIGGHSADTANDFEHRATILGAVSLRDSAIATEDRNHGVRRQSSLATGLSNGELGSVYAGGDVDGFAGYGQPLHFVPGEIGTNDTLFMPESFLDSSEAFGSHYDQASRIMMGAALQVLINRSGNGVVDDINQVASAVNWELGV